VVVRIDSDKVGIGHQTTYDLRQTCATMMRTAGVDRYLTSQYLGHADVRPTDNWYTRVGLSTMDASFAPTEALLTQRAGS
jgi:integrase